MGNKAKFRPMVIEDLDIIMDIEHQNFASPWFKEHYAYELEENPFAVMTVLAIDDKIIGYLGLWILFEEAQITTITIHKEYQRQGYGTMLIRECIRQAKEAHCERISLEVRVSNFAAQNLYENHGFTTVNIRPAYYEDNKEDAYLMVKGI